MKRKIANELIFILILALTISLSGCGKNESEIVAQVGDRVIKISQILGPIERYDVKYISAEAELETKRMMLDSLISRELLIIAAYENNMENENEVVRVLEGESIKFLLDALFEKEIISKARPSEAEIKDYYNRLSEEIKTSHIVVDSLSEANDILEMLKQGEVFEDLAVKFSIDPTAKRNQGDLGWISWGMMIDDFQETAFALQPGEISAPVKSDFGFHIIKLIDRKPIERRPSYEEQKNQIRNMIIERRRRVLMRDYVAEMQKKYPVTVEKPTCQFVLNKLAYLYPDTIGTRPRWRDIIDPKQLDRDEQALVIGNYEGGQLTLGEYIKRAEKMPEKNRPDFDDYDSLATVIFQMALWDILGVEARKMGLEEDEDYIRKVTRLREFAMADLMLNDSIPSKVELTEEDLVEYYNTHPEDFTSLCRYHLLELQVASQEEAFKDKSTISSEEEFKRRAGRKTLRPGKKSIGGDLGIIVRDQYPELFDAAEKVSVGRITDPVKMGSKWSIALVKQKFEPELIDFESVRLVIIDKLTKEKGDAIYREWVEEMKKRVEVIIYDDVLTGTIDESIYENVADTSQAG
ncbi:MAG: peptidylprolyl isomerase [candidate division Zixibacteria bacterium]